MQQMSQRPPAEGVNNTLPEIRIFDELSGQSLPETVIILQIPNTLQLNILLDIIFPKQSRAKTTVICYRIFVDINRSCAHASTNCP